MPNYLVAIGGTGQHVALAMADLLALAYDVAELPAVNMILIDADSAGTAPAGSSKSHNASAWQEARLQLERIGRLGDSFVMNPLPPNVPHGTMEVFVNNNSTAKGASEALLPARQRGIRLANGFYAEPRVGALVAEWLFEGVTAGRLPGHGLKRVFDAATDGANRIAIVGSGVGGTGAGFAPALLRRMMAEDAKAKVLASMATEWFQLTNQGNGRLADVVQKANVNSALWHSTRTPTGLTTVLWGQPNLTHAPTEEFQEAAAQVRKSNLTLPYYAAAVTLRFFARELDQHVGQLLTVAAAADGTRIALAPTLLVKEAQTLGDLIVKNRDAVARLNLAIEYLTAPYRGQVVGPWLAGHIKEFWPADPQKRDELKAHLQNVRIAKDHALKNIGESDEKLRSDISKLRGLSHLRKWAGKHPLQSPRDLWREQPLSGPAIEHPNYKAKLLVRDTVPITKDVKVGVVETLAVPDIESLIALPQVDVSKVPASDAISLVISEYLKKWDEIGLETRNAERQKIADAYGLVRPLKILSANEGDRPVEWVRRWLLLANLVLAGRATIETDRELKPFVQGAVITFNGEAVGVLSTDLLCVPLINEKWNEAPFVGEMLHSGQSLEVLAVWVRRLVTLGACRADRGPLWLVFMNEVCPAVPQRQQRGNQTIAVRWNAATSLQLPIPAPSGGQDLDRSTAENLGVFSTQPPDTPSEEVRAALGDIATNTLELKDAEGNVKPLVIFEALGRDARKYIQGDLIVDSIAKKAWLLPDRTAFIRSIEDEVLTPAAARILSPGRAPVIATPVAPEYVQWFVGGEASCETSEESGQVVATVSMGGRALLRRTYPPSNVHKIESALLLGWPKTSVNQAPPVTLLLSDEKSSRSDRITGATVSFSNDRGWARTPSIARARNPHYVDRPPGRARTLSLQVAGEEIGFIPIGVDRITQLPDAWQGWAVDFGTSSTVVAVQTGSDTVIVDFLAHDDKHATDATIEFATGDGLEPAQWYGTRRVRGADVEFASKKRVPSSLYLFDKLAKPSHQISADELHFGEDLVLDQDDWPSEKGTEHIIDLKWDRSDVFRKKFLRHHLEQAIFCAGTARLIRSQNVRMLFTLPIRQAARLAQFRSEVASVIRDVTRSTGLEVQPHFAFESQVIAPSAATGEGVQAVIVADLGGGTLDLFGRSFAGSGVRELFDSAVIGGHLLVDHLAGGTSAVKRQHIRQGRELEGVPADSRPALNYFRFLMRVIILWADSACEQWGFKPETRKRLAVQALGLGWRLPGSPGDHLADRLTQMAKELGVDLEFTPYQAVLIPPDPKESLARGALAYLQRIPPDNLGIDPLPPPSIHGLNVRIPGASAFSHSATLESLPTTVAQVELPDDARLKKLLTGEGQALINEIRADAEARMVMESTGLGRRDGALNKATGRWVTSPLSVVAETFVERKLLADHR